jgi:hypothetical protein
MTFFTDSIRRRDWPTTGILRPTGDDDLFLKYSADSVFEQINFGEPAPTLKSAGVDKFDPAGMSGGGIWSDSRPQDGKLWHPTPKLLGIEYAVNRKHGWM